MILYIEDFRKKLRNYQANNEIKKENEIELLKKEIVIITIYKFFK